VEINYNYQLITNPFKRFLYGLQEYTFLILDIFKGTGSIVKYRVDTLREMYLIGARAFPLVFIAGVFIGIILAIETGHQLDQFGAKTLVSGTVSKGMVRELGPVIIAILLAARTGAKNASEIGSMQLSQQIDALRAFGTSPVQKLVIPRTVAAQIMFLPLTLIADLTGILSGMIVSDMSLNVDYTFFWNSAIEALVVKDIVIGFTKPFFFAFFISTISCFFGITTQGGTSGLGKNTINAVVVSSLTVLMIDFVFAKVVWELF
jgi:phospholipid/cholesterol/gamma-HCH transport system permease protein